MSINMQLIKICVSIVIAATLGACGGADFGFSVGLRVGSGRNVAPVADAGPDQIVTLQATPVLLDGRASRDADGDVLIFRWELISSPLGSSAFLSGGASATPSLRSVDFEGVYVVSLVVNDGLDASDADTAVITVVPKVQNIVLLIGDGMGFEQVRAAGMYANGSAGSLSFESFPYQGSVSTLSVLGGTTDSAAAATAMATGDKVDNGVISQQIPGDGSDLETILETAKGLGASTGLVTTTTISYSTPASFAAHEGSRNNFQEIVSDYLTASQPDVLLGGAQFIDPLTAEAAGYTVVENSNQLVSLHTETESRLWGQFGETHMPYEWDGLGIFPHLSGLTQAALAILDNDPDGFFLMVEGGRIDNAGHDNHLQRNVFETLEFSNTAGVVMAWAAGRVDTLVIVTADHETGGLKVVANNGQGNFPEVTWSATIHTAQDVPVYAWGVNAHLLKGMVDNTDIFTTMDGALFGAGR